MARWTKSRRTSLTAAVALVFVAACATLAQNAGEEEERPTEGALERSPEKIDPGLRALRQVEPPPMSSDEAAIAGPFTPKQRFAYLPGEDESRSRSVGRVSDGFLVNASTLEQPHPHLASLAVQYRRGLHHTTDEVVQLLQGAARHVAQVHPGTVTRIGNLSARLGGDIPYSVSHNSGRDADIAFFLVDERGHAAIFEDLIEVDDRGVYEDESGGVFRFDVARNWALVEGLLEEGKGRLQYIFVAEPLKEMLLAYADENKVDADVRREAAKLLHQPRGALPHADHFHVRVHCSELDARSGCVDMGRRGPGFRGHADARRETIRRAAALLTDGDPGARVAALRRLALMRSTESSAKIAGLLDDADPIVRVAAARALGDLGEQSRALVSALEVEEHPAVVAELSASLGEFSGGRVGRALVAALGEPRLVSWEPGQVSDMRSVAAEALISLEEAGPVEPMIEALALAERPAVREAMARSLRYLTNHAMDGDAAARHAEFVEAWRAWYAEHGEKSRRAWLIEGFQRAGYEVDGLGVGDVWELARAIEDADHLSYNAQRALMQISGREPESLSWPKHDANFYWRRWFERRWRRLGAPPVPVGMSTLTPSDEG